MSQIITLPTVSDDRGSLTIIEKVRSFKVNRIYYIYNVNSNDIRGGHRHKTTAFNIFVRQSLRVGGIPFNITTKTGEGFYNPYNQRLLREAKERMDKGFGKVHEIIEDD